MSPQSPTPHKALHAIDRGFRPGIISTVTEHRPKPASRNAPGSASASEMVRMARQANLASRRGLAPLAGAIAEARRPKEKRTDAGKGPKGVLSWLPPWDHLRADAERAATCRALQRFTAYEASLRPRTPSDSAVDPSPPDEA